MTTLDNLARVERELREQFHYYCDDVETASVARHIERAANTIAAFVREQRERELPDTDLGPWRADGKFIYSANFDHDAMLTVSGDFNSESVRDDFAAKVADRLNAPPTDTIAAYIASAKAASQPEAAPAQNSEAVTTGWRSIETAPNDVSILVAYDDESIELVEAEDNNFKWSGRNPVTQSILGIVNPTHWMPLPAAPSGTKENSDV